jgi:Na+/melibiose symporter-like transporter
VRGLLIYCAERAARASHFLCFWEGEDLMSNERNGYRTALVLFAVAVIIAILMAFATTLERIDTRIANNETAPGTTGLAKARPPLDRAPGKPVFGK